MSEPLPTISYAIDPSHEAPAEYEVLCKKCGASLISVAGDRCVRCDEAFDASILPLARVPWLYRQRYGVVSAYARTVWRILARPVAFARELCRPVRISLHDARKFRLITIWFATCCFAAGVTVPCVLTVMNFPLAFSTVVGIAAAPLICVLTMRGYFGLISDLPTFIWRGAPDRQDELQPIHLYACAPLAMVSLVAIAGASAAVVQVYLPSHEWLRMLQYLLLATTTILAVIAWYVMPICFAIAAGLGRGRVLLLAAYLPVHAVMAAFIFGTLTVISIGGLGALAAAFA